MKTLIRKSVLLFLVMSLVSVLSACGERGGTSDVGVVTETVVVGETTVEETSVATAEVVLEETSSATDAKVTDETKCDVGGVDVGGDVGGAGGTGEDDFRHGYG